MDRRTERELYERDLRREAEISRSTANANGALMLSLVVVVLAALGGVFFLMNRQSEQPQTQQQTPNINIELPERQQAPQVQPPDVNINVPEVNVPEVNVPSPAGSQSEGATQSPPSEPAQ
jgi:uncharacterized protein HemX